jgi:hypothetical protein
MAGLLHQFKLPRFADLVQRRRCVAQFNSESAAVQKWTRLTTVPAGGELLLHALFPDRAHDVQAAVTQKWTA